MHRWLKYIVKFNLRKATAIVLVVILIVSWSFSDFTRVPFIQFPPKIQEVRADTIADSTPGTVASVADAGTGCTNATATDWGTMTNTEVSDNAYAIYGSGNFFDASEVSEEFQLSNFGIAIPDGSTINGITVDIERNGTSADIQDRNINLTKTAGVQIGTNKAVAADWGTTDATATYGSGSDVWGTTWSEAEIEAAGFGLVICVQTLAGDANAIASIDLITVTVTYTPPPTTTLSTGTNPGNSTIAPGGSITSVNGFTLTTNTGTDAITAIVVNLSTNSGVGTLTITDGADTVLGSIGGGTGSGIVTGSNSISITSTNATTGGTAFKVKVTPLSHAAMPVPAGGEYAVTGAVTDWTGTNTKAGQASDTSDTVTIDNLSPNGATSVSGTAGNQQVTINWTTSNSSDFNTTSGSVVYRWASGSAGSEVPAENSTPTVGTTNGTATVACVVSSAASTALSRTDGAAETDCTTAALTNGQQYTYKVFQKDTNGNYDVGVSIGTFTPAAASPAYTQNDFEWFIDEATVTLTDPWPSGAYNLAELEVFTQLPRAKMALVSGDKIRIQMNVTVGTANLSINTQNFALQYTAATDCTTAGGWADVGAIASGTIWRFFDNASLTDGATQVNQVSTSTAGAEGDFVESNATQNNPNAVNIGQNTEWDFAVENNGAAENTTYCFRMTKGDAGRTVLNTYNSDSYPKLTTAPGNANLMRHGNFFSDQAEKGFWWAN